MLASSDNALRAAAPLLEPLLSLAGSSSLSWISTSCKDGYTVSEIPSAAALDIPLKCFRTEYTVSADITTFARLVADSDAAQQCDPTLKEIRILESPGNGDSNTLLYTAYTSPSPWLISPRDFCVSTASVLTTREELCRVLPDALLSFVPSPTAATGINTGASTSSSQTSLVFLQNSRSTNDASCPPAKDGGKDYIRGFVHCYGYVAWADPDVVGQLRVMNLCCVDACGRIPKWVVAAAVDQNTQKLRRMSELIETTYQQQQQHRKHTADVKVAAMELRTPLPSAQLAAANTQPRQPEPEQQRPLSPPSQQLEEGSHNEGDGDERNTAEGTLSNDSLIGATTALSRTPASHAHRQLPALSHGASTPPSALVGVQTPGTMMSARTESPHATPQSFTSDASPPPSPPPGRGEASVPRVVLRGASTSQLPPVAESPFAQVVQPLAQLASASGWHVLREVDGVAVAELRSFPPLLSALNGEALCVALRVSATVRCSLDTVERILRCPARAPEIDPELVRLVAAPQFTTLSNNTERGSVDSAREGFQQQQSTRSWCSGTAATPSCQLRHLQFNAESPFTHSWDILLRCTDSELSPYEGGQLGFHTPGLPASTYMWFGASTCAGGDASPLGPLNSPSRCGSSASGFERLGLRVFGVVAVAIPRSAADVRLTHYILFDPPSASSRFVRRTGSQFAVKKSTTVAADFLCSVSDWMCGRMRRVRSLCEAQEAQLAADAMAPLDKTPLLRYMYDVHRIVGTAGNAVYRVGDVVVRSAQLPHGEASASLNSAPPPLFVFSLDFPCSLRHLSAYMSATAARTRYTMDDRVVLCEELPSSPGFSSLHVELRDEADPSFIPTSFSFLEAVGLLDAPQGESPALVLSRLNCDCPLPNEDDEAAAGVLGTFFSGRRDGVREGLIYCSGWVASTVKSARKEATRADEVDRCRSTSGEASGRPLQRLVDRVKRRFGDTPPRASAPNISTTAAGTIPGELVLEQHVITVTQYSCICVGATNDAALQSSVVAREAVLLQRFCDAVCAWKS